MRRNWLASIVLSGSAVVAFSCGSGGSGGADAGDGGANPDATQMDGSKHPEGGGPDGAEGGGPTDAPREAAPACNGLDAAAKRVGFSPACSACLGVMCCGVFEKCAMSKECVAIEVCTGQCVAAGHTAHECTKFCFGRADGGAGLPLAASFDMCLSSMCGPECN